MEFGDLDERKDKEPVLTKQTRSTKPREFELKKVEEQPHVEETPYSTEHIVLEDEDSPG